MLKSRYLISTGLILGLLTAPMASFAAKADDPVLVQYQGVKVTQSDAQEYVDMQVPKDRRPEFWSNDRMVREMIANLFIIKMLAHEAKSEGLDKKDAWFVNYSHDRALMSLKLRHDVQAKMDKTNFEALAKEFYAAHPDKFKRPEEVKAAHILISTTDRTDAEALAKAKEVLAKVKANPADFAKLADEYSDDPSVKSNHGDLGYFAKDRMVKPFADAAFAMKTVGEITGPVKSQFGYHIIKYEGSRPAAVIPFADVKDQLINQQKQEMAQKYQAEVISSVKSLKGISTNQIAVNALVKPLPVPKEVETGKSGNPATK